MATRTAGERTAEFASAPSSVTAARHLVRDDLVARGLASRVVEDALVVVTELVGNAVRHARPLRGPRPSGVVMLRWDATGPDVRIDVTDGGGSLQPHVEPLSLVDTGGRGLAIVSAVASDWGVISDGERVTVFAVVSA
jgi:anti-sigma regulatory factor (Ser/Thr protein kinase)